MGAHGGEHPAYEHVYLLLPAVTGRPTRSPGVYVPYESPGSAGPVESDVRLAGTYAHWNCCAASPYVAAPRSVGPVTLSRGRIADELHRPVGAASNAPGRT